MGQYQKNASKDRRTGWIITVLVHSALLVLFAFYGLTYHDPRPEDGIALDFGYQEEGFGQTDAAALANQEPAPITPSDASDVVTQDHVDATVIQKTDSPKKPTEITPEPVKPQQPSSALSSRLKGFKEGNATGSGQGDTKGTGNQGDPSGTANGGRGSGGSGKNGNYRLGNRGAVQRPLPQYDCEGDEGRIVVKVMVDQNGRVTSAEAGVSGSTDGSSCLMDRAKKAALRTTWEPDPNAPELQIGYITYDFGRV